MAERRKKVDPELAKVYAEIRKNFTAADLQKFTEATPTVPLLSIIKELEVIQAKHDAKLGKKPVRRKSNPN